MRRAGVVRAACGTVAGMSVLLAPMARGQSQPPSPVANPGWPGAQIDPSQKLPMGDLQQLVAPIALYPDALLATVLAASVYPDEVTSAAAYVGAGGDPAQIDNQGWEAPVASVAKAPEVMQMLGAYPDWVRALGEAYLIQPTDVMAAVQNLRAIAQQNGALVSTPQQTVLTEDSSIVIEPANPQVVYVPQYDPNAIFYAQPGYVIGPGLIGFGVGFTAGWLVNAFDWRHHYVVWGPRPVAYYGVRPRGVVVVDRDRANHYVRDSRPGVEGSQWRPDPAKIRDTPLGRTGRPQTLEQYRGTSGGNRAVNQPGREPGRPVQNEAPQRPLPPREAPRPQAAPRPQPAPMARPQPASRPIHEQPAGGAPAQRAAPAPARPAARPAPANPNSGFRPDATGGGSSRPGASPAPAARPAPAASPASSGGGSKKRN